MCLSIFVCGFGGLPFPGSTFIFISLILLLKIKRCMELKSMQASMHSKTMHEVHFQHMSNSDWLIKCTPPNNPQNPVDLGI